MKHLKTFNSFLNEKEIYEAARVGRSSWSSVLRDLEREGWETSRSSATKYYEGDDGDERILTISNYSSDEIEWSITDSRGKELNSGSFDAEGLSAGELDGEVWNYIEESRMYEASDIDGFLSALTNVITSAGANIYFDEESDDYVFAISKNSLSDKEVTSMFNSGKPVSGAEIVYIDAGKNINLQTKDIVTAIKKSGLNININSLINTYL